VKSKAHLSHPSRKEFEEGWGLKSVPPSYAVEIRC